MEGVGSSFHGGCEGFVLAMSHVNTATQVSQAGACSAGPEQGSFSSPAGLPRRMAGHQPGPLAFALAPPLLGRSILLLNFPVPQALPL